MFFFFFNFLFKIQNMQTPSARPVAVQSPLISETHMVRRNTRVFNSSMTLRIIAHIMEHTNSYVAGGWNLLYPWVYVENLQISIAVCASWAQGVHPRNAKAHACTQGKKIWSYACMPSLFFFTHTHTHEKAICSTNLLYESIYIQYER